MPFWGRGDGERARDVAPYRRIMPYLMRGRNESAVAFEQRFHADPVLRFVDAWNASHERRITFFHPFLWALVETIAERPRLNRFVAGGRLYQRDGIWTSFSAKKRLDDDSPIVVVKRRIEPGRTFEEFVRGLYESLDENRSDKPSHVDKELSILLKLPGPLLRMAVGLVRWADGWNLVPRSFIDGDPMYASVFIANLGSLKLDAAYHHLYEYGNIPVFATIGKMHEVVVPDGRGGITTRREVVVRWTYDERIEDGLYCARALERLRERLESLEGLG